MQSLYQVFAHTIRSIGKFVSDAAQQISWSTYHCLDENALMWAATFRSEAAQQAMY